MADELGAVLEAPEVTSAEDVVEIPNEVQPVPTEVEQPAAEVAEVKGDERVLPQWIRDLKTTNPAAFKEAKGIFFGKRTYDDKLKDFDLDGTKAFLEEHGGRDGLSTVLTELRGKAEEYDGLTQKIESGDISVLNDIPEESLAKLAPAVAEQWQKVDPEGWGAAMSGVFASTLQANGVPMFLERLGMMLEFGKNEDAVQMVSQLKTWAGSFAEKAQAPRAQQTGKVPDKLSEREQTVAQKESRIFTDEVKREVDSFRDPLISKELDSYFKRRAGDSDAKELAISTVRSQVVDRMAKDEGFQKSLNALMARKDKAGALKLIQSRETAAITEIAPKVGRMIFGNPGPAQKTGDKPVEKGAVVKPEAGFVVVDKAPAPPMIDRFRTTDKMIMNGQFILKDGRKLQLAEA